MEKMKKQVIGSGLLSLMLTIGTLCLVSDSMAQTAQGLPKAVSIATHQKGTLLNILGSGIASVVSRHTPISTLDRPFTNYTAWIPLLSKGQVDMGLSSVSEIDFAFRGQKPYREKHKNLRLISSGNGMALTYVVRPDSGIKTMANLKGKRVSFEMASLSPLLLQETVLRAAGVDPEKDVIRIPIAGLSEMLNALTEGRADAAWAAVGMGVVKEAAGRLGGVYWVPVCQSADDPAAKMLRERIPGVDVKHFKAGGGPEIKNDTWLIDAPIVLATHQNLSDEAAYLITKTIWGNEKELVSVHPAFKGWSKAMVSETVGQALSYHPGAIRFYKEAGVWSDKMEQIQKKLLAQ